MSCADCRNSWRITFINRLLAICNGEEKSTMRGEPLETYFYSWKQSTRTTMEYEKRHSPSTSDKRIHRRIGRGKYKAANNETETRAKSVNRLKKEVSPALRDFKTSFVCRLSIPAKWFMAVCFLLHRSLPIYSRFTIDFQSKISFVPFSIHLCLHLDTSSFGFHV